MTNPSLRYLLARTLGAVVPARRSIAILCLIASIAAPGIVSAQRMRGMRGGSVTANPKVDGAAGLLVKFNGTLRNIDKKKLELEIDGEQTLSFFVNKKTSYFLGKEAAKSGESLVGSIVTIEARREFNKDLIAVNVTGEKPPPTSEPALKQRTP